MENLNLNGIEHVIVMVKWGIEREVITTFIKVNI